MDLVGTAVSEGMSTSVTQLMQKMPFVKAILLADMSDDTELFRYFAEDMKFKRDAHEVFVRGVRGGINILYSDFKN